MQQVWAQVHNLWITGASHYLDADEMGQLNGHNEEFTAVDPVEELILSRFDWDSKQEYWREWMSATDVLRECGYERPSKADATAAGSFIRKLNGGVARKVASGRQLLMPPLKFK
jgi:putative DNA primase/helicase